MNSSLCVNSTHRVTSPGAFSQNPTQPGPGTWRERGPAFGGRPAGMMPAMAKGIWGRFTATVPAPKPGTPLWGPWNAITKLNVRLYRATGGRIGGRYDQAPV